MNELITAEQLSSQTSAAPDLGDAQWLNGILQSMTSRGYHLYKHAKKSRTRNKNKRKLLKELHRWLN